MPTRLIPMRNTQPTFLKNGLHHRSGAYDAGQGARTKCYIFQSLRRHCLELFKAIKPSEFIAQIYPRLLYNHCLAHHIQTPQYQQYHAILNSPTSSSGAFSSCSNACRKSRGATCRSRQRTARFHTNSQSQSHNHQDTRQSNIDTESRKALDNTYSQQGQADDCL